MTMPVDQTPAERCRLQVQGVVQGVGFRPFVYGLARQLGLAGFVGNDSAGVFIELEGSRAALHAFQNELVAHPPPLAYIEGMVASSLPPTGERAFTIVQSRTTAAAHTLVSPDLAICADCLRELFDPADRRYRYPFINCTNCGPRFTIIHNLPYDRAQTTMAPFPLCPACQREYDDPLDRRFHAQPNACPTCGPQVEFCPTPATGQELSKRHRPHQQGDENDPQVTQLASQLAIRNSLFSEEPKLVGERAIQAAQQLLGSGGILAVKGIGGFHLACDATKDEAVQLLRRRKGRVGKPFAIMARDLATVQQIAHLSDAEQTLLASRERPIVLLRRRTASPLSAEVAPGNGSVGVMLPYSPLHYLLLAAPNPPLLVMTSGNYAEEPIATKNDEALTRLAALADGFLLHNRAIHVPCDDAVMRTFAGQELPIRRSRGYAPFPVKLPFAVEPILAVGGEIKNSFCLAQGNHAFLSQHIGDLQNLETLRAFEHAVEHLQTLFGITPGVIACDLHPGYLSSQWAERHAGGRPLVQVQHHHAHIAALMAEHGLDGEEPVIGFAFDGTGYGPDGASWGGEVLLADYQNFTRAAHLHYFPLPGGDATIRRPYRTALAALWAAGIPWDDALAPVATATAVEQGVLQRQCQLGLNTVPTSSMGRLFDAVAALAGVRQIATYEAQAAIEFEALVDDQYAEAYAFALAGDCFDATPILQAVVDDVRAAVAPPVIAARFHNAVADLILTLSLRLRSQEGLQRVALSGGVFQNVALLRRTVERLQRAGFEVLTHRRVPPNDGGLALGQAMIAARNRSN
jgi:hydrogenase maturation protein HypF